MDIEDEEGYSTAIRDLGSLFSLTEVYLWDEGSKGFRRGSSGPKHIIFKYDDDDEDVNGEECGDKKINSNLDVDSTADGETLGDDYGVLLEQDLDVAQQMSSLGLPLSFQTSKVKTYGPKRGKRKDTCIMSSCSQENKLDDVLLSGRLSDKENYIDNGFKDTETINLDDMVLEEHMCDEAPTNLPSNAGTTVDDIGSCIAIEQPQPFVTVESSDTFVYNQEDSCHYSGSFGDWRAIWDSYYMTNYFYNVETQESTWYAPPGMEHLAISSITNEPNADLVRKDPELGISSNESDLIYKSSEGECGTDGRLLDQLISSSTVNADESQIIAGDSITNETNADLVRKDPELGISSNESDLTYKSSEGECGTDGKLLDHLISSSTVIADESQMIAGDCFGLSQSCSSLDVPEKNLDFDDNMQQMPSEGVTFDKLFGAEVNEEEMKVITGEVGNESIPSVSKRKKKAKKSRSKKKSPSNNQEQVFQCSVDGYYSGIVKYWCQRYLLFSRFDEGIKMDEEGWFSVTPECLASHQASRCGNGVIIDCFTGVGGNAIQFAKTGRHVIAIDIDPKKIEYAKHNAAIYGVEDQIDFVIGDSFTLASKLEADTVYMSPPWGGPEYSKVETYKMDMLKPHDGQFLLDTFKETASMIVMFLPRNVDLKQLAEMCISAGPLWSIEVEKNFLNDRLKAVTAYFRKASV